MPNIDLHITALMGGLTRRHRASVEVVIEGIGGGFNASWSSADADS